MSKPSVETCSLHPDGCWKITMSSARVRCGGCRKLVSTYVERPRVLCVPCEEKRRAGAVDEAVALDE